jgi:hypothetical protein
LLVETYHASDVDLGTFESAASNLTPLAVAATRMSTVVKYLLLKGAANNVKATWRFRLHMNKRNQSSLFKHCHSSLRKAREPPKSKREQASEIVKISKSVSDSYCDNYRKGEPYCERLYLYVHVLVPALKSISILLERYIWY